ncbi:MAG: PH domain-containing protein [Pseudonocardia sp.]|nr:PH domain-containing protein [Pseudonocardia sp.]
MSARAAGAEPGPGTGEGAVTIRPRLALRLAWIGAVLTLGLFVVIAVILRTSETGVFFRLADQVSMVLLGAFIAAGILLFARPRVRADSRGIEVRNTVLPKYLRWEDVRGIAFPDGASWARLDLPDDEYLPVLAIQAVDRQHAVDAIRALRALHAGQQSTTS